MVEAERRIGEKRTTEGNQFVARILTVAATCRQRQRHLLGYVTDAVVAHRLGQSAPVLLPGRYV